MTKSQVLCFQKLSSFLYAGGTFSPFSPRTLVHWIYLFYNKETGCSVSVSLPKKRLVNKIIFANVVHDSCILVKDKLSFSFASFGGLLNANAKDRKFGENARVSSWPSWVEHMIRSPATHPRTSTIVHWRSPKVIKIPVCSPFEIVCTYVWWDIFFHDSEKLRIRNGISNRSQTHPALFITSTHRQFWSLVKVNLCRTKSNVSEDCHFILWNLT